VYRVITRNTKTTWQIILLSIPMRRRRPEFTIFFAVAVASPLTIILVGTYIIPTNPVRSIKKYQNPAILAVLCLIINVS
jgi:hypothetical protein